MTGFNPICEIEVDMNFGDDFIPVNRLAIHKRRIFSFEFNAAIVETGLEISPLELRLESGLTCFDPKLFDSLPGVFNDSFPDGWTIAVLSIRALRRYHVPRHFPFGPIGPRGQPWLGSTCP